MQGISAGPIRARSGPRDENEPPSVEALSSPDRSRLDDDRFEHSLDEKPLKLDPLLVPLLLQRLVTAGAATNSMPSSMSRSWLSLTASLTAPSSASRPPTRRWRSFGTRMGSSFSGCSSRLCSNRSPSSRLPYEAAGALIPNGSFWFRAPESRPALRCPWVSRPCLVPEPL